MTRGHREVLAEKLARRFRERFLQPERAGGRLPSVRHLARELGVSVPTIRAVQALLAREGVLEIRHGSGVYVTAPDARSRRVGIYTNLDVFQPRTSTFHLQVPRDLRLWLQVHGVDADIYVGEAEVDEDRPPRADSRFAEDVASGRLAGVALLNVPATGAWIEWVERLAIPAVGALTPFNVDTAAAALARDAVRCLHAQGCRRIGLLSYETSQQIEAFRDALTDCGLTYHPAWVRGDLNPMLAGAGWEEFREIWFAAREKPDGLVVSDDMLLDEAALAMGELGIAVPERLRLVAHVNAGVQKRYPFAMTLFEFDPMRYAALLGELMLAQLEGRPVDDPSPLLTFRVRDVAAGDRRGRRFQANATVPSREW